MWVREWLEPNQESYVFSLTSVNQDVWSSNWLGFFNLWRTPQNKYQSTIKGYTTECIFVDQEDIQTKNGEGTHQQIKMCDNPATISICTQPSIGTQQARNPAGKLALATRYSWIKTRVQQWNSWIYRGTAKKHIFFPKFSNCVVKLSFHHPLIKRMLLYYKLFSENDLCKLERNRKNVVTVSFCKFWNQGKETGLVTATAKNLVSLASFN